MALIEFLSALQGGEDKVRWVRTADTVPARNGTSPSPSLAVASDGSPPSPRKRGEGKESAAPAETQRVRRNSGQDVVDFQPSTRRAFSASSTLARGLLS